MPQNIRALLLKENQNLFEKTGIRHLSFRKIKIDEEKKIYLV